MRRLFPFLFTLLFATPLYGEPASLWSHNGSTMALHADGTAREFRYENPRRGMRDEGVVAGTLLFQGIRSGDTYSGTAYVFSRRCGAVPYPVSGAPAADEKSLTLFGMAPAGFDASCRITRYRQDALRFDLMAVLIPPPSPPEIAAEPGPETGEVHVTTPFQSDGTANAADLQTRVADFAYPSTRSEAALAAAPTSRLTFTSSTAWLAGALIAVVAVVLILGIEPRLQPAHAGPAPSHHPPHHSSLASMKAMTSHALTSIPPPLPSTTVAPSATAAGIHLKLRRSQRMGGAFGGKAVFILDARADLGPDERALVARYRLGDLVVYDSKERKQNAEAAYAHFTEAGTTSSLGRSLWKNARGVASATMMALSLRVTVDKLIGGQHIECKDLNELLGAEAAIVEACRTLRTYLDTAATFDGREELIEF